MGRPRTLLFSFAHPDDESFSGVGTAMACAANGARTVLVTATRGEKGKAGDPAVCPPEELAAWRERELRAAARVSGIDEVHVLDYRDRELADAPVADIRRSLVSHIRRAAPTVVITFDPNGFNLHPDHIAISRFTSDAIAVAADPRWFPDLGPPHRVQRLLWTPLFPPWDAATFEAVVAQASADFVIDISRWRDSKAAALRAHRTQHLSVDRYFFNQANLDRILAVETWRQAWGPALAERPARDVFEGLS